jgi:predicted Rdx family selenoprotein
VRDALQAKGITEVDLQPGRSGQFDVLVDGALRYSRYQTGRFPTDEEVAALA